MSQMLSKIKKCTKGCVEGFPCHPEPRRGEGLVGRFDGWDWPRVGRASRSSMGGAHIIVQEERFEVGRTQPPAEVQVEGGGGEAGGGRGG